MYSGSEVLDLIEMAEDAVECPLCEGTGEFENSYGDFYACTLCNGEGFIEDEDEDYNPYNEEGGEDSHLDMMYESRFDYDY